MIAQLSLVFEKKLSSCMGRWRSDTCLCPRHTRPFPWLLITCAHVIAQSSLALCGMCTALFRRFGVPLVGVGVGVAGWSGSGAQAASFHVTHVSLLSGAGARFSTRIHPSEENTFSVVALARTTLFGYFPQLCSRAPALATHVVATFCATVASPGGRNPRLSTVIYGFVPRSQ